MKLYINENDLTAGVDLKIWKALDKSIENNSVETFSVIKSFIRSVLQLSVEERSLKHFQKYIFLPSYFYSISFEKKLHDLSIEHLHNICSINAALHLKEIIWLDIGFKIKNTKTVADRHALNQFYYWAFNGFSRLLYFMVKNDDYVQFKNAINEYEQISVSISNQNYDLKSRIIGLQRENSDGSNNEEIKYLKEELTISSQFETYKRHVLLGIKYWILFLFQNDRISEDLTLKFLSKLNVPYSDPYDSLNDILFFRDNDSNSYMGWVDWDFTERESGKAYFAPSPDKWLTLGFMAGQIRENRLHLNLDERDSKELINVRFLHDNLKEYAGYFQINFEKWKNVLSVESQETLKVKSTQILSLFATLKRKSIGEKEKSIALATLSQEKIELFRDEIGKAWYSQSRINRLFDKLGFTIILSSDNEIELKNIGQRTFYEKAKIMFIDGENYQNIYGVERLGGNIGRWEDSEFLSTILKSDHNKETGSSMLEVLNTSIDHLKRNEVIPDLILMSPEYSYKDQELLESKLFNSKFHDPSNRNDIAFYLIGTYDKIPIYTSLSEFIKNRVLVCDFKSSFRMRYKTDSNWYDSKLTVDIKEVTDEEARRRLEEYPKKWKNTEDGIELSDEAALTLIKTSVIIDCWSTLDFEITKKDSFVMGYIKTEIAD